MKKSEKWSGGPRGGWEVENSGNYGEIEEIGWPTMWGLGNEEIGELWRKWGNRMADHGVSGKGEFEE